MTNENALNTRVCSLDTLHQADMKRVDEKIQALDDKTQIQFTAAKEAVGTALVAQEKQTVAALDGTKEAINKADITTDKRFDLLSEKIDGVTEIISRSSGERQIYVTHSDLSVALDRLQANIEATLRPVVTFMNSQTGRSSGMSAGWQFALGAFGLIGIILGIISFIR